MKNLAFVLLGSVAVMVAGGAGCSRPTMLGANTGIAYYMANQNQTLDPLAAENLDPVIGLEGKTAVVEMERYRKTFESPDPGFQGSLVTSGVKTK